MGNGRIPRCTLVRIAVVSHRSCEWGTTIASTEYIGDLEHTLDRLTFRLNLLQIWGDYDSLDLVELEMFEDLSYAENKPSLVFRLNLVLLKLTLVEAIKF